MAHVQLCGMQISTHHKYSSGMIFVDSRSIRHGDIAAFWPSLESRYAHREGELMLSNLKKNHVCGDACGYFSCILQHI